MSAESSSLVTGDSFIFATHVAPAGGRSRSIAVLFLPHEVDGVKLGNQLRDFFMSNPLTSELWLVAPSFSADSLREARQSPQFNERLAHAAALDAIRLVTFDRTGAWTELDKPGDTDDIVSAEVTEAIRTEGLRIMFREGHGLVEAHAGLHFVKPSGSHTKFFLRAGPVVARSAHTMFVAAALLPWAASRDHHRICVDTNAIAAVGYALSALTAAFDGRPALTPVDSFGGYERLRENPPDPADQPLVLISASTSGDMAREISDVYGVNADDIMNVFYVGREPEVQVLCDLTRHDAKDADEYKIDPIPSWREECPLCVDGLTTIVLHGEDFVPESARASARMLKAVHSTKSHRAFISDFRGTGAIRVARTTDAQNGHERTMNIKLDELLKSSDSLVYRRVVEALRLHLPAQVRWIITLGDPDSNAVADLAKSICIKAGLGPVDIVGTSELDEKMRLGEGHAFVVAGTVASGRALLNVSRQLRYLHDDHIHYFLVCARPRSEAAWQSLTSDLTYGKTAKYYPLNYVWRVESEPDRGELNPWYLELDALRTVAGVLPNTHPASLKDGSLDAVKRRIAEITDERGGDELVLITAADYGSRQETVLHLNPNFAFWDGRYSSPPTQDEVFFTISSVLHTFRYSAEGRYPLFGIPGHGYVLDPQNFGRFNDPLIQACILRGAKGVELDYRSHSETSEQMTGELLHLLEHYDDVELGGSAAEFALSIVRGLCDAKAPGALRLDDRHLAAIATATEKVSPEKAPLLTGLLRFIQSRTDSDDGNRTAPSDSVSSVS